jgi:phosphate/sulfate permease
MRHCRLQPFLAWLIFSPLISFNITAYRSTLSNTLAICAAKLCIKTSVLVAVLCEIQGALIGTGSPNPNIKAETCASHLQAACLLFPIHCAPSRSMLLNGDDQLFAF